MTNIIGNRYIIENDKLGEGGFSEVYLGTDTLSKKYIAIKKVSLFQKTLRSEKMIDKLKLEVELMQKIDHPNIVKCYDVVKTHDCWYIIMEFCNAGTLENIIKFNEQIKMKYANFNREANSFYYLNQLKDALLYIKCQGYIHRDIKPTNILLKKTNYDGYTDKYKQYEELYQCIINNINDQSKSLVVKLADFGLAKYCEINEEKNEEKMMSTICGSPLYMAPELIMNKEYNSKADLWSYGVIMYQMLYGTHPNSAKTFTQLVNNLKHRDIDFRSNQKFTSHCYDLLTGLLVKDFRKRIDWDEFFNHKWFQYWERTNNKKCYNTNNSCSVPIAINNRYKLSEHNDASLGFSNLSRMNLNSYYPCSNTQILRYPASYPLAEGFKNKHMSLTYSGSYEILTPINKNKVHNSSTTENIEKSFNNSSTTENIEKSFNNCSIFSLSGTFEKIPNSLDISSLVIQDYKPDAHHSQSEI
jgi:serine/threonine protein kinase